ncbi:TPA: hypothetical protein ACT4G0_005540, partial [Escherichia coli]
MTLPPFRDFLCSVYYMQLVDESFKTNAMQDRQSTRNCMQCSVDCPPAAGSMVIFFDIYLAQLQVLEFFSLLFF